MLYGISSESVSLNLAIKHWAESTFLIDSIIYKLIGTSSPWMEGVKLLFTMLSVDLCLSVSHRIFYMEFTLVSFWLTNYDS